MRPLIAALLLLFALPVRADFTLSLTAPSWAGFDEGVAAYQRGEYATALREWRPLAEQGHADAQFRLSVMYFNGRGVALDFGEALKWLWKAADQGHAGAQDVYGLFVGGLNHAEAVKWYRKAAEQGDADAQYNLAFLYTSGGVALAQDYAEADYAEAAKWYRKAAEQGHAAAQFFLGMMYAEGQGVPQDYGQAAKWYRIAADQGHAGAQFNLGVMYYHGRGVPRDFVQAHMWFNLAASRSPPGEVRDKAAAVRDGLAAKMTPAQVAEAQRLAREWMAAFEKRKKN